MNKTLKKIFATLALGAMVFGVGVSPAMAASVGQSAYGVITANDSTEYSMSMMSLDGAFEVIDVANGKVTVEFPLQAFSYTRMGVSGTGYLKEMTVDGTTYTAQGFSSSPSAGDTGYIDVVFDEAAFDAAMTSIDSLNAYLAANVKASIVIANVIPMTKGADVHLYFSSTAIPYVSGGSYAPGSSN